MSCFFIQSGIPASWNSRLAGSIDWIAAGARISRKWRKNGSIGEPPRIEIRPIISMGAYDEHNWSVLRRR